MADQGKGTPRDSWLGVATPSRSYVTLAVIQLLFALELAAYATWSPVAPANAVGDRILAVMMLCLAGFSYVAAPHIRRWGRDASLSATWLAIAWLASTRVLPEGQVVLGLALLVLGVYLAYFLPRRRAVVHVVLMLGAYGIALTVNPLASDGFFGLLVVLTVLAGALIVGRLRESDRLYRLLVDNAADVVYLTRGGIVQWISPSVTDVLGWYPEDLIDRSTRDFWHPDDRDAAFALRDEAYDGKVGIGVFRFKSRDGHYLWIEITLKPYVDADGNGGAVGSMRDVSDRIEAEQALVASEQEYRLLAEVETHRSQQLADLDDARSRLFQNISHEFRTPLTVIHGPLESLVGRQLLDLTDVDRAELEAALRATERLARLVDGLLDVARGEAGQLIAKPQPTDLAALTRDCASMFRSGAERAGVELLVTAVAIPAVVMIDPELWMKILLNLLSNALKFTEEGQIAVELGYLGGAAELRVSDTGVGIAREDLSRVFDRFHQSRNRTVRGQSGSGIGLAVVAEIVRAVEGSIQVDSTPGIGTTFTVRVPAPVGGGDHSGQHLSPADLLPGRSQIDGFLTRGVVVDTALPTVEGDGQRGRILLVEDNDDLRSYVSRLLNDEGWSVTAVADGESALDVLAYHDLLLADVMLPGIDGVELVRRVRSQDGATPWMPIILLTAKAGNDSIVTGLSAGADDFVTKPFNADELTARVRTHMELSLLRRMVLDEVEDRAENLQRALGSNRVIGTALGILMATYKITADEAFDRLRTSSQNTNRKLRDVADEVVLTGTLPAADAM